MLKNLPISHPDTSFVVKMALSVAETILEIYEKDFEVEMKQGNEPVTIADKTADKIITSCLREKFPQDRILSEEAGLYTPKDCNNRIWIIDPIDGTKEFIKKNGEFAIQIGLAVDGKLEFGLILQPVGNNLYIGAHGEGCHWHSEENGWQQLKVEEKPSDSLILALSRSNPCGLAKKVHNEFNGTKVIVHGGVGLKLMAMARGEAHYYFNSSNYTKAWDIASPELLFVEAGGTVSDLEGNPFSYDPSDYTHKHGLLATVESELHKDFIKFLETAS